MTTYLGLRHCDDRTGCLLGAEGSHGGSLFLVGELDELCSMRIVAEPTVLAEGHDHCRLATEVNDLVGIT